MLDVAVGFARTVGETLVDLATGGAKPPSDHPTGGPAAPNAAGTVAGSAAGPAGGHGNRPGSGPGMGPTLTPIQPSAPAPKVRTHEQLGARMQQLLARALEQSTTASQTELFHHILDNLVPDEARILSALSDGSRSPVVSVHALTRAGLLGEALIENASLVGRTANVALPRMTPTYVGHLLAMGLVEIGPEDDALRDEYQILMAETDVLAALRAGARGPVPARVERRSLTLSDLGHDFWRLCFPPALPDQRPITRPNDGQLP